MRGARLGTRPRRVATTALAAVTLVLGGCGADQATETVAASGDASVTGEPAARGLASPATRPVASTAPSGSAEAAPPTAAAPSLPPGDPGLDAPSVPDPGPAAADPHDEEAVRRSVPTAALLTAETVGAVLGGTWERRPGGGDECVRPEGAVATRSMSYGGAAEGVVVETVATYEGADAADRAVAALGRTAARCGWTPGGDPRLGSASVAAEEGSRSLLAVSAEGVVVLLVGTGELTGRPARWGALVDMALGTSCPAAPDGCH